MRTTGVVVLTLAASLAVAAPVYAQAGQASSAQQAEMRQAITDQEIQLLRADIRSQRKQVVAQNLQLTEEEAVKFWPVYDTYIAETIKINDGRYAALKEYGASYATVTDAQASAFIKKMMDVDKALMNLRASFIPQFEKVLPEKKAAAFLQIDRRLQLMIDLQLASMTPLILK